MTELASALKLLAVGFLGVFAGANLTEGYLEVPYWKSLTPAEFFSWYAANDKRLIDYFRPLTIATALVVLSATIVVWWVRDPARWSITLSALLVAVMIAMFFGYFRAANESFSHRSVAPADLPDALARWGSLHTVRIVLSMLALAASLLSLRC